MKIALFGAAKPEACAQIRQILESLDGVEVVDGNESLVGVDMAFSIGGDGTFLRSATKIGTSCIPILGINAGRLGFLADVHLDEIATAIPEIVLQNKYEVEHRVLLTLDIHDFRQDYQKYALNEVAILKRDVSSMISVSVYVDGILLNEYDADGLVIATPTGSTAYAMSAGGPILQPQSHCFEIIPIAAHSLTARPLVIKDSSVLDIEVASRNNLFLIAVDGLTVHLTTQYKLQLKRAGHKVGVVRRPNHSFYDTLREKLMWGKKGY
mgnify:CR=1 FL=1